MLNIKIYGWSPIKGSLPIHIQKLRGIQNNKTVTVANSDVYITCSGTVRFFINVLKERVFFLFLNVIEVY